MCISFGCCSCVNSVVCNGWCTVAYCLHELRNSLLDCVCCGGFKGEDRPLKENHQIKTSSLPTDNPPVLN